MENELGTEYAAPQRCCRFRVLRDTARTWIAQRANRPTPVEMAAACDSFIAGAGSYAFDGRTLMLRADFRKNPNEMTGETWLRPWL